MGFLEDWAKHGGRRPDKLGRFGVKADKWDVRRFEEMLEEMRKFDVERYALCENVPTGNGLWADMFNLFNKVDPELEDPGKLDPRYLINRQVDEEGQTLPEFTRLKNWTEGDPVAAAGACISMREDFEELYDRTRTANDKAEELQQKMQQLAQAQAEAEQVDRDLDELIQEWTERTGEEPEEEQEGDGEGEDGAGAGQEGDEGAQGEGEQEGASGGGEGAEGDGDGEGEAEAQAGGGKPGKGGKRPGKGKGQPSDKERKKHEDKVQDFQQQKQLIEEQTRRLEAEAQRLSAELEQEMGDSQNAVRQIMKNALAKAADDYEAMNAVASMWGLDPGELVRLPAEKRLDLARRMNNERFRRMADLFGPMERLMHAEQRRRVNNIPEEVYDIGIGADLERLLPVEYGKLTHPVRRLEFYKDFTEGRLLQYEMRGHDIVARGGIVVCIDNSGSMQGDRELWAKAVGLCLLHLSREQNRNFYGIHFGSYSELMVFDFESEGYDLDRIIEYAEFFFNGGTNFERPLSVALDKLTAEYAANGAVDADIVFITDGQCGVNDDWLENFTSEVERIDTSVWGILIDDPRWNNAGGKKMEPLNTICGGKIATVQDILSGEDIVKVFSDV